MIDIYGSQNKILLKNRLAYAKDVDNFRLCGIKLCLISIIDLKSGDQKSLSNA